MQTQPYLFFDGRCEEAVTFYRQAIGAEVVMLMRYGDGPEGSAQCPDGTQPPADKVMHACLQIGSTQVLLSDGFSARPSRVQGFLAGAFRRRRRCGETPVRRTCRWRPGAAATDADLLRLQLRHAG